MAPKPFAFPHKIFTWRRGTYLKLFEAKLFQKFSTKAIFNHIVQLPFEEN